QMPAWPIMGETWLPGAAEPIANTDRILRAVPVIRDCLDAVPEILLQTLDPNQYGPRAISLKAVYSLHGLLPWRGRFDVVHAHFGPMGDWFRFTRELWKVPYITSFHGYDCSMYPSAHGPKVYSSLFRSADLITVNSNFMADRL